METTRNRPAVLAKFLRASIAQLKRAELLEEETAVTERKNAIDSIDAVADVLEETAAAPDPAGKA